MSHCTSMIHHYYLLMIHCIILKLDSIVSKIQIGNVRYLASNFDKMINKWKDTIAHGDNWDKIVDNWYYLLPIKIRCCATGGNGGKPIVIHSLSFLLNVT